jgi:hypothetical protein
MLITNLITIVSRILIKWSPLRSSLNNRTFWESEIDYITIVTREDSMYLNKSLLYHKINSINANLNALVGLIVTSSNRIESLLISNSSKLIFYLRIEI